MGSFPTWAIVVAVIAPIIFCAIIIFIGYFTKKHLIKNKQAPASNTTANYAAWGRARQMEEAESDRDREGVWRPADS